MASLAKEEDQGMVVLSLDTGRFNSLNALSQLFILEDILQAYEVDNDRLEDSVKVYEPFDLIVGTGTGGLVAALMGPLDMTVREAMEAYRDIHSRVFLDPSPEPLTNEERGSRLKAALQRIIKSRLGDDGLTKNLRELCPQKKIAITAMSPENLSRPTCFRTYRARRGRFPDSTLLDVLQATLSHIDEFPAVPFGSPPETFCSSSAGFCNPLDTLYDELTATFGTRSISAIISIGVGRSPSPIAYTGPQPFADAAVDFARSCEEVHRRFQRLLASWKNLYNRFDVDPCDRSSAIRAHCNTYLGQFEVRSKLEVVANCLNSRSIAVSVRDLEFCQFGVQDTLHREITKIPENISVFNAVNQLSYARSAAYIPGLMCFDNTRQDILSQITSWMERRSNFPPILWIDGPLGAGKSAIAHSIAKKANEENSLASSFFVTGRTSNEQTKISSERPPSIDNLVSTLIRDLSGISTTFQESVGRRLHNSPRYLTASPVVQMEHLLLPFVKHLPPENGLVWIIDGFDELVRQTRPGFNGNELLNFLIHHANQLVPFLRIFVTSRPFNSSPIRKPASHPHILHVSIDLTSQSNIDDIRVIAHQELVQLSLAKPVFPYPIPDDQLVDDFSAQAGGLPLWLRITRRFLEQSYTPRHDLDELLAVGANPNPDHQQQVNNIYAHVIRQLLPLDTAVKQRHLRHVVCVLLALQKPISLIVLEELFAGESKLPVEAIHTVIQALRPLLLGVEDDRPIQFLHISLRDFFHSSQSFSDLVQDVPSPADIGHCLLLRCSLMAIAERLALPTPGEDFRNITNKVPDITEATCYGVSHWTDHILLIDPTLHAENVSEVLADFFLGDVRIWIFVHPALGKFKFDKDFLRQLKSVHSAWHTSAENAMNDALLSGSLNNLVNVLKRECRFEDALQLCWDVVNRWRLYEVKEEFDPSTVWISLQSSLAQLAQLQIELGMHEMAIKSAQECNARPCPSAKFGGFLMDLLSQCLLSGGRRTEALQSSVKAVSLNRKLNQENPTDSDITSYLAFTLKGFSHIAYENKRMSAGIRASREARKIYRKLAGSDSSFLGSLAGTTDNLAAFYLMIGCIDKSMVAAQQVIRLYRGLAQKDPQGYTLRWGLGLSSAAVLHSLFDELEEAQKSANEAFDRLHKTTAQVHPFDHLLVHRLCCVASVFLKRDDSLQIARNILQQSVKIGDTMLGAATINSLRERERKVHIATSLKLALEMAIIDAIKRNGYNLRDEIDFTPGFASARERRRIQRLTDAAVRKFGSKGSNEVKEWILRVEELKNVIEADKLWETNDEMDSETSTTSSSSESQDESTDDDNEEDRSNDSDMETTGKDCISEESSDTEDDAESISEKSSETDGEDDNANESRSPPSSDTDEDESWYEDSSDWDSSIDSAETLPEDMSEDDSSSEEERMETC